MKKSTKQLAENIVKKLGTIEKAEYSDDVYIVTIPQIGHNQEYFNLTTEEYTVNSEGEKGERKVIGKTTKSQAEALAIDHIGQMIDSGELVLSDSFAEQHLEEVKDLTDKNDKQ